MQWPEFIQKFKERIHLKKSFTDNIRIEQFLSVLKGEAKHSILSIGAYFEIVEKGLREPHYHYSFEIEISF